MATLQPLGDYVLLKQLPAEEQTKSGFYLPDSAKEKPSKAEVVAVGPGTKDVTMEVKPGNTVYYKKYAGDQISIDGDEHIVLRQDGIIAIVTE